MPSSVGESQNSLTIEHALQAGKRRLAEHSQSASLDAQVLLAHALEKERAWLLAHPEYSLAYKEEKFFDSLLGQIEAGIALPYVLGSWEFFGLNFHLTPDVLIPRPETELLVDHALDWLSHRDGPQTITDIGTGSGCIAIAIASNAPSAHVTALDISAKALAVASINIQHHKLQRQIDLQQSDLLSAHEGPFDLICANLPYIPSQRLSELSVAKKEPLLALNGGTDGLKFIAPLLQQARSRMRPESLLLGEIDGSHANKVKELASSLFESSMIEIINDLAGKPRLLKISN